MAQRKTLNGAQVEVLRWIGDGCPDGVMANEFHRISAGALRGRGLVTTAGRGATWSAEITNAGREFLELLDSPNPPLLRGPNVSPTEQLVIDVVAAGGSLRLPKPTGYQPGAIDYRERARAATRQGKVPAGKRLLVDVVDDEWRIRLVDGPPGSIIALSAVPIPETVAKFHPLVRQFRDQADRHEITRAQLPRALRLLQGLVVEAERRGHHVAIVKVQPDSYGRSHWVASQHGHFAITANGCTTVVRLFEQGLPNRGWWYGKHGNGYGRPRKSDVQLRDEWEAKATGRLTFEIVSWGGSDRVSKWSDRRSAPVDELLPELLREVELRAIEQAEKERQAEIAARERERRWEAAMVTARERYDAHHRAEALRSQAARWHEASQLRAYCDAAENRYRDNADVVAWVEWAREYIERLDPLRVPPTAPTFPRPKPEDLRPFLDGFSPYGPEARW